MKLAYLIGARLEAATHGEALPGQGKALVKSIPPHIA